MRVALLLLLLLLASVASQAQPSVPQTRPLPGPLATVRTQLIVELPPMPQASRPQAEPPQWPPSERSSAPLSGIPPNQLPRLIVADPVTGLMILQQGAVVYSISLSNVFTSAMGTTTNFTGAPNAIPKYDALGLNLQASALVQTLTQVPGTTNYVTNIVDLGNFLGNGLIASTNAINGALNVRAFGAKGDGTVDDTSALQNALASAGRQNAAIFIPPGQYWITSPLSATNISIYGEPDKSWIVPQSSVRGAALTIVTAGTDTQHYSPKAVVRGIAINGLSNPSGTGFCLGTNFLGLGGGNYSANITLEQCRADGFTNGAGIYVQYLLSSRISRTTCESNYNGLVLDGHDIGITTLQIDNSNFRWSLDWGIVGTNIGMGNIGPNDIFEANKKGGIHLDQGSLGTFVGIRGNHFEKEYWSVPHTTNCFDIEIYGMTNTYKVNAFIMDNTFDTSINMLMLTNVGHAVWGNNAIYSPPPGGVLVRGPWSFLNIQDFPYNQNITSCFVAPESSTALVWSAQQLDTAQFESFGENTDSPLQRIRGYSGNGAWKIPLNISADYTAGGLYLTDTHTNGHQFLLWQDYNGTPGRVGLLDMTAGGQYIFDANISSFTVPSLSTSNLYPSGILRATNSLNGPLNVIAFGAYGDGFHDDTIAIQSALAALPVARSPTINTNNRAGTIFLPPGIFNISQTIQLLSGQSIVGAGRDATTLNMTAFNVDAINMVVTTNTWNNRIAVRDMTIVGPYSAVATTNGAAIRIGAPQGLMQPWPGVRDISTWGFFNGIVVSNSVKGKIQSAYLLYAVSDGLVSTGTCNSMVFDDVYGYQCGRHAINLSSVTASSLISCAGDTCGVVVPGDGIHLGHENSVDGGYGDEAGVTIVSADTEQNTGNGIFCNNPDGLVILGGYSGQNRSNAVTIVGGERVIISGMRSDAESGWTLGLYTNVNGQPLGVDMNFVKANGILGACNHPEWIKQHPRNVGGSQVELWGAGANILAIDYSAGNIMVGGTNNQPSGVFNSFIGRGNPGRLRLESSTDPTNFWSEIRSAFSNFKMTTLNSANEEWLRYGSSLNGSASQGVDILGDGFPRGGANGSVSIGWGAGQGKSALSIYGGLNIGGTNDAGLGNLLMSGNATVSGNTTVAGTLTAGTVGALAAGTGTAQYVQDGYLKVDTSIFGNAADTTEDNLTQYTVPANTLLNTGDGLEVDTYGNYSSSGANKTLRAYVFGTLVMQDGPGVRTSVNWHYHAYITRTSATTAYVNSEFLQGGNPVCNIQQVSTSFASPQVFKMTAQGASGAANEMFQNMEIIKWHRGQ